MQNFDVAFQHNAVELYSLEGCQNDCPVILNNLMVFLFSQVTPVIAPSLRLVLHGFELCFNYIPVNWSSSLRRQLIHRIITHTSVVVLYPQLIPMSIPPVCHVGINLFSGKLSTTPWDSNKTKVLVNCLTVFVVHIALTPQSNQLFDSFCGT